MSKRLILATALSATLATPAFAATCEEQLVLLDVLLATEGANLEPEANNQILDLKDDALHEQDAGNEEACLEAAEEALSMFSQ